MDVRAVDLDLIRTDGGTQPREAISLGLVETYAEDMAAGATFPPLVVFHDGVTHWLADGFHRYFAAKGCGLVDFKCEVRAGTLRDAILFSVGTNAAHGLRRTAEDKRRAVLTLLNDEVWVQWSDSEIARRCNVSQPFVGRMRQSYVTHNVISEPAPTRTYVNRHGTESVMATGNIGRAPERPAPRPQVMPYAPAPRSDDREATATLRADLEANGSIPAAMREVFDAFRRLPSATDAAARFPNALRHTVTRNQCRAVALWFHTFADNWTDAEETDDVAA